MSLRWIASLCVALFVAVAHAATSPSFELKASVAFAKAPDQYLLVYSSNVSEGGPDIYGRVLRSDGSAQGVDFRLSRLSGAMSKPVVAYSPQTQRFLVVWGRKLYAQDRAEIIGVSVGLGGKVLGEEFRISFSDIFDTRPSIAYCPGRERFLVTWTRGVQYNFNDGVSDVYGQFVSGDGARLQGSNFAIAVAAKNQFKSDVTCDVVADRFLVVWEDQRNHETKDDIYGQLISSDGAMLGGNFQVAGTAEIERRPVAAANTRDGTYLVVWESLVGGESRLFSQKMDGNGKMLSEPIAIGAELEGKRNRASVAYLPQQNVFFVVFYNSGFDGRSDGIYGQFVEGNGSLRQTAFPVTTAPLEQNRPDVAAGSDNFLVVWTDFRDTANDEWKHHVYEYYGRIIGNDMPLSSRWRNPQSR